MLAPWTALWDHNAFARMLPALGVAMQSPFLRGAVSGVGLVTVAAGVRELFGIFAASRPADDDTPPHAGSSS